MTERDIKFPSINLPDGQQFLPKNQTQHDLLEGLCAVSEQNPAIFSELGEFVFGENFEFKKDSEPLRNQVVDLQESLVDFGYKINCEEIDEWESFLWLDKDDTLKSRAKTKAMVLVLPQQFAEAERLEGNLWNTLSPIDRANLSEAYFRSKQEVEAQIDEFSKQVNLYKRGQVVSVSGREILKADYEGKTQLVSARLRELLALSIVNPKNKAVNTKFGWGRQLNDLILLSGGGEKGKDVLFDAIENLSDVERALVLSQISMTKRFEILMVGLDQINEREMASFINNAVYEYRRNGDAALLEEIILVCDGRDGKGDFSSSRVIDAILTNFSSPDFIFKQLAQASYQLDFTGSLRNVLASHPDTSRIAYQLLDLEEDDYIPWNRRI